MMSSRKALFLDLFGTLIEDHGVLESVKEVKFKSGALDAVQRFNKAGYAVIISVCRADMPLPTTDYVSSLQQHIAGVLTTNGLAPDSVHFVSVPESKSTRLRPLSSSAVKRLARTYDVPLHQCVVAGDLMRDVKVGRDAGAQTVLLSSTSDSPGFEDVEWIEPDYVVEDLAEAADYLARGSSRRAR
jgi:histidinol phosphatase-like enzyme